MGKILTPRFPEATSEDYKKIQGGKPTVTEKDGVFTITHNYPGGEGMVVRSRMKPETVTLTVDGNPKEFRADLLKQFHGNPCETHSLSVGGEGYDRKG